MNRTMDGYGPHLMLDLDECNPAILNDLDACFNLLNELPEKIGMTKITKPYVFRYPLTEISRNFSVSVSAILKAVEKE